jgi:DNA (cytosine-5)-methyltransferase 1
MQATLFESERKNLPLNSRPNTHLIYKEKNSGTLARVGRYEALKEKLDNDTLFNNNWCEIDTLDVLDTETKNTFFDLFSGAGGMSVGFRNAGFSKVASVEIDKDASATIRRNFPASHHFEQNIQEIQASEIDTIVQQRPINIVCGGPPCQGFSVAGLRKADDPRNQLFREYIRIVKHLQPDFIIMENVPGLLTMQNGAVYEEIRHQLAEAGYPNISVRILEAAEFGVPQLRARVVIIGNRLGLKNPYPKPFVSKEKYLTIHDAIDDIKNLPFDSHWHHVGTTHSKEMEQRLAAIPPGGSLYDKFRDAWKRQYRNAPSMTVKENHGGVHVHYELNRVLTAREMARLQTFPDDYIFSGTFKRAYWQIGNAVPCLLAQHIGLAIKTALPAKEQEIY